MTYPEFKKYIENKFLEGMSWDNHGSWHLDHIIPLNYAKDTEDVIVLNHYSNFQPLWAFDNLSKHAKLPENVDEMMLQLKLRIKLAQ